MDRVSQVDLEHVDSVRFPRWISHCNQPLQPATFSHCNQPLSATATSHCSQPLSATEAVCMPITATSHCNQPLSATATSHYQPLQPVSMPITAASHCSQPLSATAASHYLLARCVPSCSGRRFLREARAVEAVLGPGDLLVLPAGAASVAIRNILSGLLQAGGTMCRVSRRSRSRSTFGIKCLLSATCYVG